jgi:hypothetical protein
MSAEEKERVCENSMEWFKSSYCADGSCLEVARIPGDLVGVRDSKRPDQDFLTFGRAAWTSFISAIKVGELTVR